MTKTQQNNMTMAQQLEKIQALIDSTPNKTRSQDDDIMRYQRRVINELLRQIQESNVEDSIAQCQPLTDWVHESFRSKLSAYELNLWADPTDAEIRLRSLGRSVISRKVRQIRSEINK